MEEKCDICGKDWSIKVDGKHIYCAKHYVENEDEECLYEDLAGITEGYQVGKSKESSKKILKEIKKKHPEFLKRYEQEKDK